MAATSSKSTDRLIDIAEGTASSEIVATERRLKRRLPYTATVALVMVGTTSKFGKPVSLQAKDLSFGGISVFARTMLYPGARGAMQLIRSTGDMALVGVQVQHCRYVGGMQHHVGFSFIPLPAEMSIQSFLDKRGRMIVLDPALKPDEA